MNKILNRILNKLSDNRNILTGLEKLSNSELNSFLLELFKRKTQKIKPPELLKQFTENRFVAPSDTDIIKIKEIEIEWLKYSKSKNYMPLNLSPLTPLGSCSAIGFVDQNNIVSGLRGTETVSDATNVLALKIAEGFKQSSNKDLILRYVTIHRHVRAQYFTNPNFSSHFSAFCMASGGLDKGNYKFEISQLKEHIGIIFNLLKLKYKNDSMVLKFYIKDDSEKFLSILERDKDQFWYDKETEFLEDFENHYYNTIQFKIFLKKDNQSIDLADGGFVDWTQKLLENKKHRLLISGIGLELLEKI